MEIKNSIFHNFSQIFGALSFWLDSRWCFVTFYRNIAGDYHKFKLKNDTHLELHLAFVYQQTQNSYTIFQMSVNHSLTLPQIPNILQSELPQFILIFLLKFKRRIFETFWFSESCESLPEFKCCQSIEILGWKWVKLGDTIQRSLHHIRSYKIGSGWDIVRIIII